MRAVELTNRKIKAQIKDEIKYYTVDTFDVVDDKPLFTLYSFTGRKIKMYLDCPWEFVDTPEEGRARGLMKLLREIFGQVNEEAMEAANEIFQDFRDKLEQSKKDVTEYRKQKCNKGRQSYDEGKLSVFYDIRHGHTIHNFMSLEEILEMKERFNTQDILRGKTYLDNLQAFDENGELVLNEWSI